MNYNDLIDILKAARFAQKAGNLNEKLPQIKKAFNYAKKNGENEMALHFATILQRFYLVIEQDLDRGIFYQEEVENALYLYNIEVEIHLKYSHFAYYINRSRSFPDDLFQELKIFVREYEPYTKLKNQQINLFLYPLIVAFYYKTNNHQLVEECCNEGLNFYQGIKSNKVYNLYYMMAPSLIIRKKYEAAHEAITHAQKRVIGKSYNLSLFAFYEVVNLLHWGKHQEALDRTMEATQKKQINPALAEQWNIVKGFLQVLSNAGLISKTSFKVSKLLNELPIFSKDRPGNYSNILILKSILALQKDRELLVKNQEAIEKVTRKYFDDNSREATFIRMLLEIPASDFDFDQINSNTKEDFHFLKKMEKNAENIDIIPFDVLWDIALAAVKKDQYVYTRK